MRKFLCLFIMLAAVAATPTPAMQKPGERTVPLNDLMAGLSSDEDLDHAIADAAAHPLGTAQNPVRVGGPAGERAYIARLRCADGSRPKVGQRGAAGVGAFGTIVDVYPLDCGSAVPGRVGLVMDMYHEEHREDHAPAGFAIEPR